jgi:hypothetical protein
MDQILTSKSYWNVPILGQLAIVAARSSLLVLVARWGSTIAFFKQSLIGAEAILRKDNSSQPVCRSGRK